MMTPNLLLNLQHRHTRAQRRRQRRIGLYVEQLETRCTPSGLVALAGIPGEPRAERMIFTTAARVSLSAARCWKYRKAGELAIVSTDRPKLSKIRSAQQGTCLPSR